MNKDFTPELVMTAYLQGVFPMGHYDGSIRWYAPDPRCVFELDNFHVPKRLARTFRQGTFELYVNRDWDRVIHECAARDSTWITDDIMRVYGQLHMLGYAHTVEAYKDGQLAGGLYGVSIGGAFMGESMFHIETDASKICLVYLVERLKSRGYILLDTQYMTTHLAKFNATTISRDEYLIRLNRALLLNCQFD